MSSNNNSAVKIYPNPAADYLVVESVKGELLNIAITDLNGHLVYSENAGLNTSIDLSSFAPGPLYNQLQL